VIRGLSIGDGTGTPQKIYLEVDSDKICYVTLPNGTLLTSTSGVINYDWEGIAGAVRLILPKDSSVLATVGGSLTLFADYTGDFVSEIPFDVNVFFVGCDLSSISTKANAPIDASSSLFLESVIANETSELYLDDCASLESFEADNTTTIVAKRCKITAKSIGDFLIAASVNNPIASGTANFSDGTNANKKAVAEYINNTTYASAALGNAAFDAWVAANLASWSITANAAV